MGNENERKRNPERDREAWMGHKWDDTKTGVGEENVGQTNDRGFGKQGGAAASGVGSVGTVGGSPEFLTGEESTGQGATPETGSDVGEEAEERSAPSQSPSE
jgi:hypothetical protein